MGHTPTALSPPPDPRNFAWREYGLRVGIWRIFDLMAEFGLPMCHLLNASVCESFPDIPRAIRERGDEAVGHGYSNSERQADMDEATEARMIAEATETLAKACGKRPAGWMGPWISETAVTPDLLQEAGYTYLMDWPADDQPFWMRTRGGRILSVPYPIEVNDSPTMLSRAQSATDFCRMIIDQFDEMARASAQHALVCGISLHTFVAGQPFRLAQLRRALAHVTGSAEFENVWVTTPGQIARYAAGLPEGTLAE
jgi:hypothetical protein